MQERGDAVALAAALNVPLPALLFEISSEELALAPALRVRMLLAGAWFFGRFPLTREDVKHYEAALPMVIKAHNVDHELPELFEEQPPSEQESEMLRALARAKRMRANFFDGVADKPDAPHPAAMRDAARQHRQQADEIEQLLPEEEK